MYYIDSLSGHLDASTTISNRQHLQSPQCSQQQLGGYFDGMTIDAEDNVYIAIWEAAQF